MKVIATSSDRVRDYIELPKRKEGIVSDDAKMTDTRRRVKERRKSERL